MLSPEQLALFEFCGLAWKQGDKIAYAPLAVAQAFIQTVQRSGLDPWAKQIYAANIGGKWTILAGIDGLRLVAQRTGKYLGQTPVQWTADGQTWVDVWLSKEPPAAARVGVKKAGEPDPTYMVATWAEFGQPRWKQPAHMLGIRAESHALRKAFPMEMSGLYTPEDFDDAEEIAPSEDWYSLIEGATTKDELVQVVNRAKNLNEMTDELRKLALMRHGDFNRSDDE